MRVSFFLSLSPLFLCIGILESRSPTFVSPSLLTGARQSNDPNKS